MQGIMNMNALSGTRTKRKLNPRWIILGIPTVLFMPVLVYISLPYVAYSRYQPQEGDILFQSLPRSPLVNAIEGATKSPFSHCGIVVNENGSWIVYEAYSKVESTPLSNWVFRSRSHRWAVYRLDEQHQQFVPAIVQHVRGFVGRPYDSRYEMDDEKIYCSELIYKAFLRATGRPLGGTVQLGELNWQPFTEIIQRYEGGPVPLEREMITPKHLASADQLMLIMSH